MDDRERDINKQSAADVREIKLSRMADRQREKLLEQQLKELESALTAAQAQLVEQSKRASMMEREFEKRSAELGERDRVHADRLRSAEEAIKGREQQLFEQYKKMSEQEAVLRRQIVEFAEERERYNEESRQRVQSNSGAYVAQALDILAKKEDAFQRISLRWSLTGAAALIIGLATFAVLSFISLKMVPESISWQYIVFAVARGLIVVGVAVAIARYAFLLSSSYMEEALKNADRRHAINFGRFYIESYGAAAEWSQVKEAFEHWNISSASAFTRDKAAEVNVDYLERMAALVEQLKKLVPTVKE